MIQVLLDWFLQQPGKLMKFPEGKFHPGIRDGPNGLSVVLKRDPCFRDAPDWQMLRKGLL